MFLKKNEKLNKRSLEGRGKKIHATKRMKREKRKKRKERKKK